ncbi:MAG: hypothetical protein AAGH90_01595 [Pseudomonadota bacterium]
MKSPKSDVQPLQRSQRRSFATLAKTITSTALCVSVLACTHPVGKTISGEAEVVKDGDQIVTDGTDEMDESDIRTVRDVIASGDYNDDKLPKTPVPGIESVDREIPQDRFKKRVEAAKERDAPD